MKKSPVERAIEGLEGEMRVLEMAIEKLRQQQNKPKPARKPRPIHVHVAAPPVQG